jgi:hypothetical protein
VLKKSVFIFSVAVSLTSGAVFAKGTLAISCSDLLAPVVGPAASPFAYEVSDFEGLYLDILSDIAQSNQVRADRANKFAEDFLNKKAAFLNQAIYVVRQMTFNQMQGQQSPTTPEQVFNMIASLGVDPTMYGFVINKEQQIELRVPANKPSNIATKNNNEVADEGQGFVGFIDPKGSNERDLPAHLQRAVGFGREGISREEAPQRKTGLLKFSLDEKTKLLVVVDMSSRLRYTVDSNMLAGTGATTDDKIMRLEFSQGNSWFVSYENTANPKGIIGFAIPQ